jgi:hypothetical protein
MMCMLASHEVDGRFNPQLCQPKTRLLLFAASALSMHHDRVRVKTWLARNQYKG